jgi:hypothetical protein
MVKIIAEPKGPIRIIKGEKVDESKNFKNLDKQKVIVVVVIFLSGMWEQRKPSWSVRSLWSLF